MSGWLYMVATPIGNLGDITRRAQKVLAEVDLIACEDIRVTKKLLLHLGINNKELISLHHHTSPAVLLQVIKRIKEGLNIAYTSDAGTPGLADPGGKLVLAAVRAGIKVIPIPGASAVIAALSVAGVPANKYLFLGYPPHKKGRQKFFQEIAVVDYPVVFFESTHRILKSISELANFIGSRPLVVCRELTKIHETIYRGGCVDILEKLTATSIKGEFVVVVAPK